MITKTELDNLGFENWIIPIHRDFDIAPKIGKQINTIERNGYECPVYMVIHDDVTYKLNSIVYLVVTVLDELKDIVEMELAIENINDLLEAEKILKQLSELML